MIPDSISPSYRDMQLCQASRSSGDWAVAEGVLTTLVTAALGNERICRRLLRVGLDQLIDAAEDDNGGSTYSARADQETATTPGHQSAAGGTKDARQHRSKATKKHPPQAMPGSTSARPSPQQQPPPPPPPPPSTGSPPRGPATDGELGLDEIDEVGVDGVLRQSSEALALRMEGESRQTCSALATSLLQALGPFNYVSPTYRPGALPGAAGGLVYFWPCSGKTCVHFRQSSPAAVVAELVRFPLTRASSTVFTSPILSPRLTQTKRRGGVARQALHITHVHSTNLVRKQLLANNHVVQPAKYPRPPPPSIIIFSDCLRSLWRPRKGWDHLWPVRLRHKLRFFWAGRGFGIAA